MGLGIWIPYVNLVLAGVFARRYWSEGGRGPALLGILGMVGQTVASIRLLVPAFPVRTPVEFVVLAIGISLAVGLVSGILPARRAAAMDPVEALAAE